MDLPAHLRFSDSSRKSGPGLCRMRAITGASGRILVVIAIVLLPIMVHDRVEQAVARQSIVLGDFGGASQALERIWFRLLTPATREHSAIAAKSARGLTSETYTDVIFARTSHVVALALVVAGSFLLLFVAIFVKRLRISDRSMPWMLFLSVLCAAALGTGTYLYIVTPGVWTPLNDLNVTSYALAIAFASIICAAILRLEIHLPEKLPWLRIAAALFLMAAILFAANAWSRQRTADLYAESLLVTPGFTLIAPKSTAYRTAPSYYFRFDHPTTAKVGDTFVATLDLLYNRGDFASDQTLAPRLESPGNAIYVPPCQFMVSANLASPNLKIRPLINKVITVGPVGLPSAPGSSQWSWLVVADSTGQHYLDFSTQLTAVGTPTRYCKTREVFPVSSTARLVDVQGGVGTDELAATNVIALVSGVLGVLTAVVGLRKRSASDTSP